MPETTFVAQSEIYAEAAGIEGTWAVVNMPARASTASKERDGGAQNSQSLLSRPEYADLTMTRPFDRTRDFSAWRRLNDQVGKLYTTITVFVEDVDGVVVDKFTVNGRLMSCTPPSGDSKATTTSATVETVWAVDSIV